MVQKTPYNYSVALKSANAERAKSVIAGSFYLHCPILHLYLPSGNNKW